MIVKNCRLFKEYHKNDLSHELKFLLATNLRHFKGGKNMFFRYLIDNRIKWEVDWDQMKTHEYFPQKCCNGGCPYLEECQATSLYYKMGKKIWKTNNAKSYVNLEEATEALKAVYHEAICDRANKIWLIKAQTAIGKTEMYCRYASEHPDIPFLFVVPTIKLQKEVGEKLRRYGVKTYISESCYKVAEDLGLEVAEKIRILYESGCGEYVRAMVLQYLEDNKSLPKEDKDKMNESLNTSYRLDGSCCAVITHKLFLHLKEEILKKYVVIVDEDILLTVMKETANIQIDNLNNKEFLTNISDDTKIFIHNIMKSRDKEPFRTTDIGKLCEKKYNLKFASIYGLLRSSVFYKDSARGEISYFTANPLPEVKFIVLSATLDGKLYRDYCMGRDIVQREVPEVKYKGNLIQCTTLSMSRQCIKDRGYEVIQKKVQELTGIDNDRIITFKTFSDSEIHYGKVEGFNDYSGKNIAIIGTPHFAECVYKLFAKYLGYDCTDTLSVRRIEYGGFSFPFMTYGNPHLRNLQIFYIHSELEQAVGRARLLRFPCTVYVFSNFPLGQAELDQNTILISNEEE